MGEFRLFLGVAFKQNAFGASLSQRHYILQLLERLGMQEFKAVSTQMICGSRGTEGDNTFPQHAFEEMIGALLFLSTRTRLDISVAVTILSRHCASPRKSYVVQLKRILRYLKGTKDFAIQLSSTPGDLVAFSDANCAGDRLDLNPTTGVVVKIGDTTVYWRTQKQKTVALQAPKPNSLPCVNLPRWLFECTSC